MVDAGVADEVFSGVGDDDDEAGAEGVILEALEGLGGGDEGLVLCWGEEVGGGDGVDEFLDRGEGGTSVVGRVWDAHRGGGWR